MITKQLDLGGEAQQLYEQEVAELDSVLDEITEQAEEEYDSFADVPTDVIDAYEETESELIEVRGTADALIRTIVDVSDRFSLDDWVDEDGFQSEAFRADNDWDDLTGLCVFTIEEFSGGALSKIQDEISSDSFEFDAETGDISGMPKQGRAKVIMLNHGVIDKPGGVDNIANLNSKTFEFLFDKLNELNTTGSTDLGNSSLKERMSYNTSSESASTED